MKFLKLNGGACVTLVALTMVVLSAKVASADNNNLIVPGVSIGSLSLKMPETALYKMFGDPSSMINGQSDWICYVYSGTSIYVDKATHQIFQISTSNPQYATTDGLKVGSSLLAVKSILGDVPGDDAPVGPAGANYSYPQGLTVGISQDGKVNFIGIWAPGGKKMN